MKRVKKDPASFQQLGASQMGKVKGGDTIQVMGPDGKPITVTI
jgi:hypothetical protein